MLPRWCYGWGSDHNTSPITLPSPQSPGAELNNTFATQWRQWRGGAHGCHADGNHSKKRMPGPTCLSPQYWVTAILDFILQTKYYSSIYTLIFCEVTCGLNLFLKQSKQTCQTVNLSTATDSALYRQRKFCASTTVTHKLFEHHLQDILAGTMKPLPSSLQPRSPPSTTRMSTRAQYRTWVA